MDHSSSTLTVPPVSSVPRHIAIIMDGNGRWATQRFLPRFAGHAKGVEAVRGMVEACVDRGVSHLTLFAFSSENWRRPADEVSLLMRLFMTALEREVAKMHANDIRLKVVGDLSRFDAKLQTMIANAERRTAGNTRLTLTICANYGGRWDILQAVNKLAASHPGKTDFTEEELAQHLCMAYAPEPDLFIRTGGEERVSNFLLWQLAYTEFYFTQTYWPDFDARALDLAIDSYQQRERRFGRTSEQLVEQKESVLMLITRVLTAVVLLIVLLAVLYSNSFVLIAAVAAAFFGAAAWECFRLFRNNRPLLGALVWTAAFLFIVFKGDPSGARLLFMLCMAVWAVRLAPALKFGLPPIEGLGNRLLNGIYGIAILGCFVAIVALFRLSPLYLLSVMAVVWVADIGAYFSGKAFGRRKLAPSISPGKSWEGAIGGWLAVLLLASGSVFVPALQGTFAAQLVVSWGWPAMFGVMTLMVAASVAGDLFESMLKRRAGMKDSSNLLPGHGGVLDRIDALVPALPLAVLFTSRFQV